MGDIKQANFRIDSDTAESFRKFCEENNFTQAQGFDHLVELLELDKAKKVIPDRVTEIETFEMHVKAVTQSYLNSLELAENAEDRVREEFQRSLESKDNIIATLQAKIADQKQIVEAANVAQESFKKDLAYAKEQQELSEQKVLDAQKATKSAEDIAASKQANNDLLTSELREKEAKLADYEAMKSSVDSLKQQIQELKAQLSESDRALESQKKDYEHQLSDLQKDAELNKQHELSAVREENAGLKAKITMLQERIEELKQQV